MAGEPHVGRSRRGIGRWARRLVAPFLALVAAWLVLAIHPQPLFAFSARRANVVLHGREPLPPQAEVLLDEIVRRVSRSPLYDTARIHHVFLCDSPALFALFTLWNRNAGGVAQIYLGGNVFIRPSRILEGVVIGPSGKQTGGERTLAYFIAHEVTHVMTADRIGRWRYSFLATFQQEGYADHVAFDHRVDLALGRKALAHDAFEMSPRRSGLYARYELLVAYLLERRRITVDDLLARRLDADQVETELQIADDL
jgi:hypothetical protein